MPGGQCDKSVTPTVEQCISGHQQRTGTLANEGRKGGLEVVLGAGPQDDGALSDRALLSARPSVPSG